MLHQLDFLDECFEVVIIDHEIRGQLSGSFFKQIRFYPVRWAPLAIWNCRETIDGTKFPSSFDSPKIPAAVFAKEPIKAGTERARSGSDQGCY